MDGTETDLGLRAMVDKLLGDVANVLRPRTLPGYRAACNRILALGERKGLTQWSEDLERQFLKEVRELVEREEIGSGHGSLHERVARMMGSLAETGDVDLSWMPRPPRKYLVDDDTLRAVEEIAGDIGDDMSTMVRHLLWFAAQDGLGPLEIDDPTLHRFLVEEVPATCPSRADRAARAVRLTAAWVAGNGGQGVRRDWSYLKVAGPPSRLLPGYSEEEIGEIVAAIDDTTASGMRDKAIILLAYSTGLRGIDIRHLRRSDIDWRRQTLTVRQSKTGRTVTCVLNGETANAIADYLLKARPECDAPEVFLTLREPCRPIASRLHHMLDRRCRNAGVEKVGGRGFHGLRRSFETTLVSRGVPVETVSDMAGHKTIKEDKPYITYDREMAARVAMGFGDVPVTAGAYAPDAEGGDR